MTIPTVIYGSESWTTTKKKDHLCSQQKLLNDVRGHATTHKIIDEIIISDQNIFSINYKKEGIITRCKGYVDIRIKGRLPKKMVNYRQIGKSAFCVSRKRWLEDRNRNS